MRLIDSKHIRDLWAIRGRMAALCLIVASGVGILFGIDLAIADLWRTQNVFLDEMHFADLELATLSEDTNNLPNFSAIPNVVETEQRLVFPATIPLSDGRLLAALAIFQPSPSPRLNRFRLIEGRLFQPHAHEVVIDRALAAYHGYRVGETIEVRIGRNIHQERITGIAISPEFLITASNPDYVVAEPGSLGVLWGDLAEVSDPLGFSMVNSLLFRFAPSADTTRTARAVITAAARLNLQKITPRGESYSVKSVTMNLVAFEVYSPAIVLTLVVLSVAMGIITFRRFAIERQRDIAILLSLGYRRAAIAASFLRIGLAIGALGSFLGLLIGAAMAWSFADIYASAMHLPIVMHGFSWPLAGKAMLVGFGCGLASITVAVLPLLRLAPRTLMQGRETSASGLMSAFANLPVVLRYSVRVLGQNPGRTAAAVLAMAAAIAVAISYGMAMTSTFRTVEEDFGRQGWSHAVDFRYQLYLDEVAQALPPRIGVVEPYLRGAVTVRHGTARNIAQMAGIATSGGLLRQAPIEGREIAASGEAVISHDLARDLNIRTGATITLEKNTERLDAHVVGITNDVFLHTVTIPLADAQRLEEEGGKVSGAYVKAASDASSRLLADPNVARATEKAELVDRFRQEMHEKMGIVYITIAFSVGVSILFVTTLVYLDVLERRAEYAVLRSLGFTVRRITGIILTSVALQVTAALLLCLPLAYVLATMLNARMGEAWFAVRLHAGWTDIIWPLLAVLPVAPLVGLLGACAVMRLNIPNFLRERSI